MAAMEGPAWHTTSPELTEAPLAHISPSRRRRRRGRPAGDHRVGPGEAQRGRAAGVHRLQGLHFHGQARVQAGADECHPAVLGLRVAGEAAAGHLPGGHRPAHPQQGARRALRGELRRDAPPRPGALPAARGGAPGAGEQRGSGRVFAGGRGGAAAGQGRAEACADAPAAQEARVHVQERLHAGNRGRS